MADLPSDLVVAGVAPAADEAAAAKVEGRWRSSLGVIVPAVMVAFIFGLCFIWPLIAPVPSPTGGTILDSNLPAFSPGHFLGTDAVGNDEWSRLLYGGQSSLEIALAVQAIGIVVGGLIGAVAGYLGGWVDAALMRFTDMVLAFPRLVLLILVVALFSPSLSLIILVLGLTQWPGTTRIVRGDVLSLREREYIQAARALGFGRWRIIFRHLVPNVLAPVIVTATLGIGNTIVLEAGLSFLGLGVQPPTPSWGSMVSDGRENLIGAWWIATFPGLAIVLTVLAFNLVGDALRDALDPRLRT